MTEGGRTEKNRDFTNKCERSNALR